MSGKRGVGVQGRDEWEGVGYMGGMSGKRGYRGGMSGKGWGTGAG